MLQISKSYKEILDDDLDNGVFELKKNTPLKITSKNNNVIFRFIEDDFICVHQPDKDLQIPFTETLNVSVSLSNDNIAIIGHECYSREFAKAVDLFYVFLSSECDLSKCCCYAYDLKHSLGGKVKDIIRFHDQCISSMKYALTICFSAYTEACRIDLNNIGIHFGLVTEKFNEDSLKELINELKNTPSNPQNALEYKIQAQHRQNITELPILESFLNKKIFFDGKSIDLDVRIMDNSTHTMSLKFVDGHII